VGESVSVLDHLTALIDAADKRYQQRFDATEKAIEKAEEAINRRIDLLNELRADVVKKGDFAGAEQRILDLASRVDRSEGGGEGRRQNWAMIVAAIIATSAVVGVINFVLAHLGAKP